MSNPTKYTKSIVDKAMSFMPSDAEQLAIRTKLEVYIMEQLENLLNDAKAAAGACDTQRVTGHPCASCAGAVARIETMKRGTK